MSAEPGSSLPQVRYPDDLELALAALDVAGFLEALLAAAALGSFQLSWSVSHELLMLVLSSSSNVF